MDSSVVEPVHVVECCPLDVFDVAPGTPSMNEFGLVETVETLGESSHRITLRSN